MEDEPDRSVYCRTCRRALSMLTGPDGQLELLHAVEVRGQQVDHRPDPVPLAQLPDPIIECDFCGGQAAVVYLAADQQTQFDPVTARVVALRDYQRRHHAARVRRTETRPGITNLWGTRWSACHGCAAHVDSGDLPGLITQACESMPAKYTRGKRLQQLRGLLHDFYSGLFDGTPRRQPLPTADQPGAAHADTPGEGPPAGSTAGATSPAENAQHRKGD